MSDAASPRIEPLESRRLLTFTLTNLGFIRSGGGTLENGVGTSPDINNSGNALGMASTGQASLEHAMLRVVRSGKVKLIDMGNYSTVDTFPEGLSQNNRAVGEFIDSKSVMHSFVGTLGKNDAVALVKLNDVKGLSGTVAYAVNSAGTAAGIAGPSSADVSAVVWTRGTGGKYSVAKLPRVAAPLVPGSPPTTYARDISDAGVIAGYGQGPQVFPHAAIWKKTSKGYAATDLGTLSGSLGNSYAYGINELAQAVGSSSAKDFRTHPVLFAHNSKGKYAITDLGLPSGADEGVAMEINDSGVIVGKVLFGSESHAFLWAKNSKGKYVGTDLNAQLPAGSKWALDEATSINNSRTIVGNGSFDGGARTWMLSFSGKGYTIKLAPTTASVQRYDPAPPPQPVTAVHAFSRKSIADSVLV